MQVVQYKLPGQDAIQPGIEDEGRIFAFGESLPEVSCIREVFLRWSELLAEAGDAVQQAGDYSLSDVELVCPVPPDAKTICIGLNYRDHAIESGMEIPSEPVVFSKLAGCLCGPEAEVPLPACSKQVDYEAEMVVVIGSEAWQCTEQDAASKIFGYACGHDVSARDWQLGRPGGQWLLGKSFPNFAPIGPGIVPASEIVDANQLAIKLRLNGETLQESTTSQLIFTPNQLIAHLSQCVKLLPGDVIFTGTPPGVGMARKPARFLADGDITEVEIEGLGILRNRFVAS